MVAEHPELLGPLVAVRTGFSSWSAGSMPADTACRLGVPMPFHVVRRTPDPNPQPPVLQTAAGGRTRRARVPRRARSAGGAGAAPGRRSRRTRLVSDTRAPLRGTAHANRALATRGAGSACAGARNARRRGQIRARACVRARPADPSAGPPSGPGGLQASARQAGPAGRGIHPSAEARGSRDSVPHTSASAPPGPWRRPGPRRPGPGQARPARTLRVDDQGEGAQGRCRAYPSLCPAMTCEVMFFHLMCSFPVLGLPPASATPNGFCTIQPT